MHEMPKTIENSLRQNAKIIITEHSISPTLLLGRLPVSASSEKDQLSRHIRAFALALWRQQGIHQRHKVG